MKSFNRKKSIHQRRKLSAIGAASAGLVMAAVPSNAAIVASGIVNQDVNLFSSPFDLDMNSDSLFEYEFTASEGKDGDAVRVSSTATGASWISTNPTVGEPDRLSSGALIDSSATYSPFLFNRPILASDTPWSWNPAPSNGYMGVVFEISGNTHYGWVEITSVSPTNIVVNQWAYESVADTGILAGVTAVPEPTTGLLLGLATAAVIFMRRR